ncbi:efflux RND transporter periplasmic adaptor subunit [Pontibacter silvestris]|uniref:Efflux RND transporter periplasmic adaptor subunit n=1 Tax=Pontibacter silvestris TaxID=2305183 RepID=A0ABW4WXK5_9BACT|nr:efflux RND transporter periplasmic adaptor subunit [Pontibacter silvestris]MCC9135394.1 efflux RND transporter periplasmic adaptor subunit [Pontibacter silvestris]
MLAVTACTKTDSSTQADVTTENGNTASSNAPLDAQLVQFSQEQQEVSEIEVGPLQERELSTRIQANGQLSLPPQGRASVSPLIGGMVRSITIVEGDFVQKGKVLATIENPELIKLQQDYLTTRNQLAFAEQDFERQKTLSDEQVGARKKFEQAHTDLQVQQAKLKALATQLQTFGISPKRVEAGNITSTINLIAPISGYVQEIEANIGTFAEPNKPILQLVDDHHLHLDLNVFEKDFHKLEKGQKVIFTLPNVASDEIEAEVFAVGKSFEGESRVVPVHAEIKNNTHKGLLPGMFINANILTGKHAVPSLPEEAVVLYQSKPHIFLKAGSTTFRMLPVETGVTENGYTEVSLIESLPANSTVVQRGAYFILAEKMKAEVSED